MIIGRSMAMSVYVWIVVIILIAAILVYQRNQNPVEKEDVSDARYIVGVGGQYDGQSIPVEKEMVLGRDSTKCSLIYSDIPGISSVHCKVKKSDNAIILRDLGSSFGTFKSNGEKLVPNRDYILEPGDMFYLAKPDNTFIVK